MMSTEVFTLPNPPAYNAWPMLQNIGSRLVCLYSRGHEHSISYPERQAWARYSDDGGRSWSPETQVADSPDGGDVPIAKGRDGNGKLLFGVRTWGENKHHDLYSTSDGRNFELLCRLTLDPMPMQITDIFAVAPGKLMALWFTGDYRDVGRNAWGTLESGDHGRHWVQNVVEKNLPKSQWPTEPSAVVVGKRILAICRSEICPGTQFQLESSDGGETWIRQLTNITDVAYSTPNLLYDVSSGIISNYYYVRGAGVLKRRTAQWGEVFKHPHAWGDPEIIATGSASLWDAGNVNAVSLGHVHAIAFYSGTPTQTEIRVAVTTAPEEL